MFDLDGLRMGNLERVCSEHLRSSLAVGGGKIKHCPGLLCMERVVGWWSEALEKVASDQRYQTAAGTTNQKFLFTANTKEKLSASDNEMRGWGL